MATTRDIDLSATPSDPEDDPIQPPLSGTVDDDDDVDDEREDENEAPVRALSEETDTREEFRLDQREEDADDEIVP